MELSEADRICLVEAETRGRLPVPVLREGREIPDAVALKRHLDDMVSRGLLVVAAQSGSNARTPGARLVVDYQATDAGVALRRAIEARDLALELLGECRGALASGGGCEARLSEVRKVLSGPQWRALLQAIEPVRRH